MSVQIKSDKVAILSSTKYKLESPFIFNTSIKMYTVSLFPNRGNSKSSESKSQNQSLKKLVVLLPEQREGGSSSRRLHDLGGRFLRRRKGMLNNGALQLLIWHLLT